MPMSSAKYRKYKRCVSKVSAKDGRVNPFAVCRVSTGYGLKRKLMTEKERQAINRNIIDKRRIFRKPKGAYFIVKPSGERKYFKYKKDAKKYADKSRYYLPIYTKW